jgi:hypothetical protein
MPCPEFTRQQVEHVAKALWKREIEANEHNERYKFIWYADEARTALKASWEAMNSLP